METQLTLRPGAPGTKRLAKRYGERLVRVRCLYDEAGRDDHDIVRVRLDWHETELRLAIRKAGAVWRPAQRTWEMTREAVRTLEIRHRVASEKSLHGVSI